MEIIARVNAWTLEDASQPFWAANDFVYEKEDGSDGCRRLDFSDAQKTTQSDHYSSLSEVIPPSTAALNNHHADTLLIRTKNGSRAKAAA